MAVKTDLNHNHPLFLHPSDTTGAPIISIQLIGSENYSTWSRAMEIRLLGNNKLGLIDGTLKKGSFDAELGHQWDRCNAIVLGWIMSSVSRELITGILYARDARKVWEDLKERFDKARSQILMTSPTPSINKAYEMLIEMESQRSVTNTSTVGEGVDLAAMLAGKGGNYQNYQKQKRNWNVQCDFCHMKGHTKQGCYKIISYPQDFKNKKKGNTNTAYNVQVENFNPNLAGVDERRGEIPEEIKK
ncbi:uncharacterized protein LOC142163449 [Nicotiana tabacum]|uniref:Uncharacterized protein LOC142163449 n=1 Tax=Nicotiana tabacum TaxID=4097 RepID=A0AC58RVS2_TOBAC